jgi:hypothetical protein
MTAQEAIDKADRIRPNSYDIDIKLTWLNELDAQIYNDIVLTHEDADVRTPPGLLTVHEIDADTKVITVKEPLTAAQAAALVGYHAMIRGLTYTITAAAAGSEEEATITVSEAITEEQERTPVTGDVISFSDEWVVGLETELIAQPPYDRLYVMYLFSQIDFHNAEIARYNNSLAMFGASYQDFSAWYNRTHMPLQKEAVYN